MHTVKRTRRRLNKKRFFSVIAILAIGVLSIVIVSNLFKEGEAMTTPLPTQTPEDTPDQTNDIVWKKLTVDAMDTYKGTLILVNKQNKLPEGYEPEELVRLEANGYYEVDETKQVLLNKDVAVYLDALCKAANDEDDFNFKAMSGFREISYQQLLFNNKIDRIRNDYDTEQEAIAAASMVVVPPYASEHHTGLALDISSEEARDSSGDIFTEKFGELKEGKWLAENCWDYGFTLRYTKEKSSITGVIYEPWHIRFVGIPHSAIMKKNNLCLEEYIDLLKQEKQLIYEGGFGKYLISYQTPQNNTIEVPTDKDYTLSGDGCGGFIVTIQLD